MSLTFKEMKTLLTHVEDLTQLFNVNEAKALLETVMPEEDINECLSANAGSDQIEVLCEKIVVGRNSQAYNAVIQSLLTKSEAIRQLAHRLAAASAEPDRKTSASSKSKRPRLDNGEYKDVRGSEVSQSSSSLGCNSTIAVLQEIGSNAVGDCELEDVQHPSLKVVIPPNQLGCYPAEKFTLNVEKWVHLCEGWGVLSFPLLALPRGVLENAILHLQTLRHDNQLCFYGVYFGNNIWQLPHTRVQIELRIVVTTVTGEELAFVLQSSSCTIREKFYIFNPWFRLALKWNEMSKTVAPRADFLQIKPAAK